MKFLILLFVLISCVLAITPSQLSQLQKDIEELKAQWDTLTEKQQKAVESLERYFEYKSVIQQDERKRNLPEVYRRTQRDEVSPGVYVDVSLENQDSFSIRQTSRIDFEEIIISFFDKYCIIPLCGTAIATVVEDLLPDLIMLQSLQGNANSTQGVFDLMVHFLAFPGSIGTVNDLIYTLFDVAVSPSTSVSYFTAKAEYSASFKAASLKFEAQAFSLLQSYNSIIEYRDANGNKAYDKGEEVKETILGTLGWNPTTYRPIGSGPNNKYVTHEIFTSTKDGSVRFFCDTSNFPLLDKDGQVIQPNSTKCTINIRNFPYSQNGTYLAMKAQVALVGGQFSAQAGGILKITPSSQGIQGGYYTWVEKVDVNGKSFSVAAQASATAKTNIVDFTALLTTFANGNYQVDAKEVVFSFQTNPNPSFIVWDPSVGYGELPVVKVIKNSSSTLAISMILVALFSLIAMLF